MGSTEITPAERKKIEALIREAKEFAENIQLYFKDADHLSEARLLNDLAGVAEEYLKEMKDGKH